MDKGVVHFMKIVDEIIKSVIDIEKPFIVAANGPGIGFGSTILGHADYAICTESSYFLAPFSSIGLSPEFCSTYLFPKAIGKLRASRALLFAHKVRSNEALDWGLVNEVIPDG